MKRLIIILSIFIFLCCGCNDKKGVDLNYFGGEGGIHMVESHNFPHVYYDDSNIYFNTYYTGLTAMDSEYNTYSICEDASCEHKNKSCKSNYIEHIYFVMDDELYEVNRIYEQMLSKSIIKKAGDTEILYKVSYPKDMDLKDKNYSLNITNIYLVDNTYLYVNCGGYILLLDKEFNLVLWHENTGKEDWCMIKDNVYYYVSDLLEITMIDLDTKSETVYELDDYVIHIDSDEEYFYYVNDAKRLCKVSVSTGKHEVLYKGVFDFLLGSEYIYLTPSSLNMDPNEEVIIVLDKSGNIVNKIDNKGYKYAGDQIREVNEMIIVTSSNSVLMFELDGSNPKEYVIER